MAEETPREADLIRRLNKGFRNRLPQILRLPVFLRQ